MSFSSSATAIRRGSIMIHLSGYSQDELGAFVPVLSHDDRSTVGFDDPVSNRHAKTGPFRSSW